MTAADLELLRTLPIQKALVARGACASDVAFVAHATRLSKIGLLRLRVVDRTGGMMVISVDLTDRGIAAIHAERR